MSSSSSPPSKICFNPDCRETKSDRWRKGWRLRAGGLADLCDRCASAYEEVRFCEAFHSEAAGWRNCESCGKRVHCGCIASTHAFTLLDAGGVECMACTRKSFIMASNQIWPPSLSPSLSLPERLKDISAKSWSRITGSSSGPGHWWQAPYVWNSAASRTELHPRMPCEVDRLNAIDKLISGEHPSISNLENKKINDLPERITSGSFKLAASDSVANGNLGVDSLASLNTFRNEGNIDGLQDAVRLTGENDPTDLRKGVLTEAGLNGSLTVKNFERQSNSCQNISLQSALKDDPLNPLVSSSVPFSSPNEANNPMRVSGTQSQRQTPPSLGKKFFTNSQNGLDISGELQTQVRNRSRGEGQRRNQVLPRYWPRVTDQELQQMSGDSNSVITPLFEKMLSASDAGRIGRLVLPKKCAEAYFPTISQPEGLPLQVQDAKGKEWMFQFRFWPNNNSRMYVLEGVTPCIQSMQLQAGDTVTFSRIDPEGKLVMGFRKASSVQSEQDTQAFKSGNGSSTNGEVNSKVSKTGDPASVHTLHPCKGGAESTNQALMNQVNPADPKHASSRVDKSGGIPKEGPGAKASISKRKGSSLGSKNKRLRITNEDSLDLKLTWEEAQELLRPPPNRVPSIVVIEGHEFEEYEEAPVFGMPTIFTTSYAGEKNQWVQCEDCSKWRKLPMDVLLPSKWICSDNVWDPKRSSCSSVQEITTEQLDFLLSSKTASKRTKVKEEKDTVEASDGLDTLANLAILGEDEVNLSQPTTKHPRHRPGCTCIVCIQPPSGKGPKHKPTCTCNVCLTVKRRFRTLMLRREKRQSEKEAETAQKPSEKPSIEAEEPAYIKANDSSPNMKPVSSEGFSVDPNRRTPLSSPLKGHIDLNIQPEREEELSPTSDSGNLVLPHQDGMEPYPNSENLVGNRAMTVDQSDTSGSVKVQRFNSGPNNSIQLDAELSRLAAMALSVSASTSATG